MRVLLVIAIIFLPLAMGNNLKCYFSVESKYMKTDRISIPCTSDCATGEAPLPGGEVMTMRGCHDMFSELAAHFDSETMTKDEKAALAGLTSDKIHRCKGDLCNAAPSIASTFFLLVGAAITAIAMY